MNCRMDDQEKYFTITWRIKNFSLWHEYERQKQLISPGFLVNAIEGTRWKLKLVKLTGRLVNSDIALLLQRESDDGEPDSVALNVELSFLDVTGSPLKSQELNNITFFKDTKSFPVIVSRENALDKKRTVYLPQEILTVRCRMSNTLLLQSEYCTVRTEFGLKRMIYEGRVENFDEVFHDREIIVPVRAMTTDTPPIYINMHADGQGHIIFEGILIDRVFEKSCHCQIFILHSDGNQERCTEEKEWLSVCDICMFSTTLKRTFIMDNRSRYLPNNVLTFQLEATTYKGKEFEEIDKSEFRFETFKNCPQMQLGLKIPRNSGIEEQPNKFNQKKVQWQSTMKQDLMSLCNDRKFCDTELRTEEDTFPAHRSILCVRSRVFKAMFSNDMREKSTDHVDITDLNSEIVRRMLLFMYTDIVEDLDWEKGRDLYTAADKYEILSLKQYCSSFLINNFSISNVCEALVLADMHQDSEFKKASQVFILKNKEQIFRSDGWKSFVKNHGQLAAETMCLLYK